MSRSPSLDGTRLAFVDAARGVTILWVTAFHFYVDTRGVPGVDATPGAAAAALTRGDLPEATAVVARSLVGLPGFRLDLLLLVTGLVLCLGRPLTARAFVERRARSVLPNYWLGSIAAAGWLLVLAGVRAQISGTPFGAELHTGMLLGGQPYRFEWLDILRSVSILGRLESPRTMQVVAPSMWYLVLIAQLYLLFPWMRALLDRAGPLRFIALCMAVTWTARALVLEFAPFGAFDANAAMLYTLPCRLLSPAMGMAAAGFLARAPVRSGGGILAATAVPGLFMAIAAAWLGIHANEPGTLLGLIGPALPLLLALPGLWMVCVAISRSRHLAPLVVWSGRHSLSLLVAQDLLRLVTGTLLALGLGVREVTWWLLPPYLGAALLVTRLWDPVPRWFRVSAGNRVWTQGRWRTPDRATT